MVTNKGGAWEVENQFRDFAMSSAEDSAVFTVYSTILLLNDHWHS